MAGTREGGIKAAETNKRRYGEDFYQKLGRKGGHTSRGGGFQAGAIFTRLAGAKGGRVSRRKYA